MFAPLLPQRIPCKCPGSGLDRLVSRIVRISPQVDNTLFTRGESHDHQNIHIPMRRPSRRYPCELRAIHFRGKRRMVGHSGINQVFRARDGSATSSAGSPRRGTAKPTRVSPRGRRQSLQELSLLTQAIDVASHHLLAILDESSGG